MSFFSSTRMSLVYPKAILQQNYLNSPASKMEKTVRFSLSKNRFMIQSSQAKYQNFLTNSLPTINFWKNFLTNTIFPHLMANLIIIVFFSLKELLLIDLCWLGETCEKCLRSKKYAYLFTFVSMEYLIPVLMFYFLVFFTIYPKSMKFLGQIYFIVAYFIIYIWYLIWDFEFLQLFDAPTPDSLVYFSLLTLSLFLIPLLFKCDPTLKWKKVRKRAFITVVFIIFLGTCMTILSNLANEMNYYFRKYNESAFQFFILLFSIIFEEICLWFCVIHFKYVKKDWGGSNLTTVFFSKVVFLSIFSFRIANFSTISYIAILFYFNIISILSFFFETITGRSLLMRSSAIVFAIYLKIRKKTRKKIKFIKKNKAKNRAKIVKTIGYQKFDIMFSYIPRLLSFIFFRKWTVSQPAPELIIGCSSSVKDFQWFYAENLIIFIAIDVCFTMGIIVLVWKGKVQMNFIYDSERIGIGSKIMIYVGYQFYFEYLLIYYLTTASYQF